jgi:hypothetical protein
LSETPDRAVASPLGGSVGLFPGALIGTMTEFGFLAEAWAPDRGQPDLVGLALRLAHTPCGPLHKRHIGPDRELAALPLSGQKPDAMQTHSERGILGYLR